MSSTLSNVRYNVRVKLSDLDVSPPVIPGYRLDQAISDHMQGVAAEIAMPLAWTDVTALTANTDTYTVTSQETLVGAVYRTKTKGLLIEKISSEWLARLQQTPATSPSLMAIAVTEADPVTPGTRSTIYTLWPAPNAADTLQVLLATTPGAISADADALPLGEFGLRAVEYGAAWELLSGMSMDQATRLGVDKLGLIPTYLSQREHFVEWEKVRIGRQRTSRTGNLSSARR